MRAANQRPFHLVHGDEQLAEVRRRAARLERLCSEMAVEVGHLTQQVTEVTVAPARQPSVLLSVEECAEQLGISRSTTFGLVREGQLASIKVGARRLIPRASLETFIIGAVAVGPTAS